MVQWLRIRLPRQGTQVLSLVWEDSTCCGATKPVSHSDEAREPQGPRPASHRDRGPRATGTEAHEPQGLRPEHPRARALKQAKPTHPEKPN